VVVADLRITRGDKRVLGDDLAQQHGDDHTVSTRNSTVRPMWTVGTE